MILSRTKFVLQAAATIVKVGSKIVMLRNWRAVMTTLKLVPRQFGWNASAYTLVPRNLAERARFTKTKVGESDQTDIFKNANAISCVVGHVLRDALTDMP